MHQTIIKGIKDQLFLHNYLVLPDFGGFVLKKSASHFSASGGMLFPPSKTVGFNVQLKQNDGILANWLQNELKCDQKQALEHLKDFSEYCKSVLNARGRLSINGLGFFYLDTENNMCFEPQQQVNFLTSSFGLAPVTIKEIEKEIVRQPEKILEDRILTGVKTDAGEREAVRKIRNYRKMAVAAVSGLIVVSTVLLVVFNSKINGQLNASVFGGHEKAVYSVITYPELSLHKTTSEKKDYVVDANGVAVIEFDHNKTVAVQAVETAVPTETEYPSHPAKAHALRKNYEIVVGAFSILSNAERMVGKLKTQHFDSSISGKNNKGLYIVNAGGFSTREEAIAKISEIKASYPNAWIKKAE